jgi:hypothetical protein
LFRTWIEVGQNPETFWDKTPLEVHLILHAVRASNFRRHNEFVFLAWRIASLMRAKKIPSLKSLLLKAPRRANRASWEEDLRTMDLWVVATRSLPAKKPKGKV